MNARTRKKRPGLTHAEHADLQRQLRDKTNELCSLSVLVAKKYPLSRPPRHIKEALRRIDKTRDALSDVRDSLGYQFYEENPDFQGLLG